MPLLIYTSSQLNLPAVAQCDTCTRLRLSSWGWFLSGQGGVCDGLQPAAVVVGPYGLLSAEQPRVLDNGVCSVWLEIHTYHGYLILSKY